MASAENAKKKAGGNKLERKQSFFLKFSKLLEEYPKVIIANGDNVGSNQMQKIRIDLRGKGTMVMGKKTIMRKVIRGFGAEGKQNPWENILPHVKGNVAFIFCKSDLHAVKAVVDANKVQSPARAGAFAPNEVVVPAGNTGMEPTKTSFFQALSIPTKISKGQVEIIADVNLIKTGQKVGTSEAALLQMLNIKPFKYGLRLVTVFEDGAIYDAKVLDITPDDIVSKFRAGVARIAAVSLSTGIPTMASVPHSIVRGYKNIIGLGLVTNISFPKLEEFKKLLAAGPAPSNTAAAPAKGAEKKEEKKEAPKKVEEAPVEDTDMGLSLFD
jgi:large subunit ribosomal protein LP0